jgi:hypothetical protein
MSLKFTYNNAARTLIETHFNDDYVEFGYAKGI